MSCFSLLLTVGFRRPDNLSDRYAMTSVKRGVFMIINNDRFLPETGLNRRVGAQHDVANLCKVFDKLGFDIRVHVNITAEKALQVLTEGLSENKHSHTHTLTHFDDGDC